MGDLPPKLFFRIGEVAGLVGVEPHVLRYWEREFRSIRPTKSAKGQRVYSRKDVENLIRVKELLYRDGFTIAGAKKRLHHGPGEAPTAQDEAAPEELAAGASSSSVTPTSISVTPASVEPPSSSRTTREKLVALRDEVEAFLTELSPPGRR